MGAVQNKSKIPLLRLLNLVLFHRDSISSPIIVTRDITLCDQRDRFLIYASTSQKPRLLVLTQYYSPEHFGINALVEKLRSLGSRVSILTGQPNYPDGVIFNGYRAASASVARGDEGDLIRVPIVPRGAKSPMGLVLNYLSFICSASTFGSVLTRKTVFDVIFVYAPSPLLQVIPAILLGKLRGVPVTVWVQDLWPESLAATGFVKSRVILWLVERVVRWIYRNCTMVFVQSEAFRPQVVTLIDDETKIQYLPNAVSFDGEDVPSGTTDLALEIASRKSILFAGNFGAAQSLGTVLQAALQLADRPDIHIYLIGSGNQMAELEKQIETLNLHNVHLPGRFPNSEMRPLFQAATALLASLRDDEIFARTIPSKIQAYMTAGKPIIASLNGEGARIVAEADAGFSSPAGDSAALARTIRQVVDLPERERFRLGANGLAYAKHHFSLDKLAVELPGKLSKLVSQSRAFK